MMKTLSWLLFLVPSDAARIRPHGTQEVTTQAGKAWMVAGEAATLDAGRYEFHGTFRDLSLWRKRTDSPVAADGPESRLWVIEYSGAEQLETEGARAKAKSLNIVTQKGNSLVIEGDVPTALGYDACGGEPDKVVLPVADFEVRINPMPSSDFEKYSSRAQIKDAKTEELMAMVNKDNIEASIRHLAAYGTRLSFSGQNGLDPAADWASALFEGYGFNVEHHDFQPGSFFLRRMTPQIIATLPGTTNPSRVVVLGAHLDSIAGGLRPAPTAPGADDNGSGSATVLELARIISESGIRFKHTIKFVLFTGEEQGLVGSRKLAEKWKVQNVDIVAMLNMDMTGFRRPDTPISVNVMSRNSDPSLNEIVTQTATTYFGNEIDIGATEACCSDQQAFFENGYVAGGIFEMPVWPSQNPNYHKETDLPDYLDFEQARYHAMTALATAMIFAEPSN